ncbi:MAG: hypothetical protein IJ272_08030 [Clostridia bacterium]|nr:hypothetical protein [Clostridia bacterium]
MNENNNLRTIIKEKTVTMHTIFIVMVCVLFAIINFVDGVIINAILIFIGGVVATIVSFASKGKLEKETRGFILSIMQLLIIIFMSVAKHELQDMFALMLGSMSIAAVYYNKRCLYMHWIIMDVAAIVGIIFNDMFYGGVEVSSLARGIAGINIGAALICYLITCSITYINEARIAQEKSDKLVKEVQDHVEEAKKMNEQQAQVVSSVASISGSLAKTSSHMQSVSKSLSDNADRQQSNIEEISNDILRIDEGADESLKKAQMAVDSAENSARLMMQSNEGMQKMVVAMEEIELTSKKINNIVKNIEDIAFQTNILALNASTEAARAGSAGK